MIFTLVKPISQAILACIHRIFNGKTRPIPAIQNKLLLMSATKLARKIRNRELKCEDVMRVYIDRARLVQPYINAIVDERYEEAVEDAKRVDNFLESGEKSLEEIERDTPLLGVPFTCKESIGIKGLSQTAGIYKVKGRKAEKDSDAAEFYRKAGAIPVTVTNVPEGCLWWDSANYIYGITKNPFDNSRTPGGSSGGESALITTGGAVIGIGSDLAGSIRVPSSFCGIYGHKTTTGVVSNFGKYPYEEVNSKKLDPFVSIGPMCRYAEDLPLLLKIMSGHDQRLHLDTKVDFSKVKLYYMEEFPDIPATPGVKHAVRQAVEYFEKQYSIKAAELNLEELKNSLLTWECKILEAGVRPFTSFLADGNGKANAWLELFKNLLRLSKHRLPLIFYSLIIKRDKDQDYYELLKQHGELERKLNEIFKEDAILLVPTHPEPPPFYYLTIPYFRNMGYTAIFNALGLPSTSIPAGICDGLPIGIQAVSGRYKDHLTISAAVELDKYFGGWISPCPFNVL